MKIRKFFEHVFENEEDIMNEIKSFFKGVNDFEGVDINFMKYYNTHHHGKNAKLNVIITFHIPSDTRGNHLLTFSTNSKSTTDFKKIIQNSEKITNTLNEINECLFLMETESSYKYEIDTKNILKDEYGSGNIRIIIHTDFPMSKSDIMKDEYVHLTTGWNAPKIPRS